LGLLIEAGANARRRRIHEEVVAQLGVWIEVSAYLALLRHFIPQKVQKPGNLESNFAGMRAA
jgi:hypothetical protein